MAKLYYIIGTMGSSKTAQALIRRHDAIRNGKRVLMIKSALDTRDGKGYLCSRAGICAPVDEFNPSDNLIELFNKRLKTTDLLIVDEVELLTSDQAEQLKQIVVEYKIDIYAYGLRTNFMTYAFEGSKRVFELADSITTLENLCPCGEPAIFNSRYDAKTGNILYEGPEIEIGGNERYIGLCYKCYHQGNVKDKLEALEKNRHRLSKKEKKNLYIDFDGVILDTIPVIYKLFEENGISNKDPISSFNYLVDADWQSIIYNTPEINDSVSNLKKIINSNLYNVYILTQTNSDKEGKLKEQYLKERIPDIHLISVHKKIPKTDIVEAKGSILIDDYSGNLREWTKMGGIGIKFSRELEENCPFPVIDNLDALLELNIM
jgi:thymidine kinase